MTVIRATDLEKSPVEPSAFLLMHARSSVNLHIAGITMEIRSDNPELCEAFGRRYRHHVTTAPAHVRYYVVRDRDDYLFWSYDSTAWRWSSTALSVDALVFLTDAVAISALVNTDPSLISYHAAVVAHAGSSAAIAGDSTAGKTTTTLACGRFGMRIYSDERLLLRDRTVQPFLRTFTVRDDGAQRLLSDDPSDRLARELSAGARENLSAIDLFDQDLPVHPEPLRALFVLSASDTQPRAREISPFDALPAMTRWADARGSQFDHIARTISLLSSLRCYRLTLGTPADTARCIAQVLDGF